MTVGTVKTQGTRLYFAESASEILKVACATAIQGLGGPRDQIESTCLDSTEHEFRGGLANPAQVTVGINVIPRSAAHQALMALKDSEGDDNEVIAWMVVMSDQTGAPTQIDSDGYLVSPGPTTRSFRGYVADFTEEFATNEIVRGQLIIQRSGPIVRDNPAADLP